MWLIIFRIFSNEENNYLIPVVKQRLQMYNSPYQNVMTCIRNIYKNEGAYAFYRSYTTQLTMNIPFQTIHFVTYEVAQVVTNPNHIYNPIAHMVSGIYIFFERKYIILF